MAAVEKNFSNPENDQPQWLDLVQTVFDSMTRRWDKRNCGGGLRWQIFQLNRGYDYKNSISNGGSFHMAARLARYTSNDTYVKWANTIWDWMEETNLINGTGRSLFVLDGFRTGKNCSKMVRVQCTYNAGLVLSGSAYLYNYTNSSIWETRTHKLLEGIEAIFKKGVLFEQACVHSKHCNDDQRSFRAYFLRFSGSTALLMEDARKKIDFYLESSTKAVSQSCNGGRDGVT